MPEAVLLAVTRHGASVSAKILMKEVMQSKRKCTVPASAHPKTMFESETQSKLQWSKNKWQSCRIADSDTETSTPNKRLKKTTTVTTTTPASTVSDSADVDTESNADSDNSNNDSADGFKIIRRESMHYVVPPKAELEVDMMMRGLNDAIRNLGGDASRDECVHVYESDLMLRAMWNTKTARKYFPISRFIKIVRAKYLFPAKGQMVVTADRRSWSCKFCPEAGQDMKPDKSGKCQPWHRQNCLKHFRSSSHCQAVIEHLRNAKSTALENALEQDREINVFCREIQQAIIDDAIISCARKSLSLTSVPVVLDVVARALVTCRGKQPVKNASIIAVKSLDEDTAKVLSRLNAAVDVIKTKVGPKVGCRRGRMAITKRMRQLSHMALQQKVKFLKSCEYLSVSCDESDTFSSSAPLAAALQGCSKDFLWGNLFIGQGDVAHDKTGSGCYDVFRKVCDSADPGLFGSIVWICTDGASAMRSTAYYAGLDGKEDGQSFHAYMRHNSKFKKLPDIHGLCHLFDLGIKFALKACVWSDQWLDHIKSVYNWFAKSPSKKSKLKALYKEMQLVQQVATWRLVYPKYYCPTRWLGITRALKAILTSRELLLAYSQVLVDQGYGPDRGDPENPPPEARTAQLEPVENYQTRRFHEDAFYKWGDNPWDLGVTKPPMRDTKVLSEARRLSFDEGRASTWRSMPDGPTTKKSKLLSERIGLTNQMLGLNAIMYDALLPYSILCERLQTSIVPI